ncbi:MAG: 3-dehydroquinate synthase, partial [Pseudohongiellaceae bacterium]|nr:3-dehydroquinate synthase [Pseudohongiellaceae bacterium]
MHTLKVELGERSYPIYIGSGLMGQEGLLAAHIKGGRALIVTNEVVAPLYLDTLKSSLAGVECDHIILPDGEHTKNMETLGLIYDKLLENRHERSTTLIALGGGVIG